MMLASNLKAVQVHELWYLTESVEKCLAGLAVLFCVELEYFGPSWLRLMSFPLVHV
jgi:hypothetical protein